MNFFAKREAVQILAAQELAEQELQLVGGGDKYDACVASCSSSLPANASNAQLSACINTCMSSDAGTKT